MKKSNVDDLLQKIVQVLREKGTDIELEMVLRSWGKILNLPTEDTLNRSELCQNIKVRSCFLKEASESRNKGVLEEGIKALRICSRISEDDIQQFLKCAYDSGRITKYDKVFISHAHEDKKYVKAFAFLLQEMGLSKANIFCTSIPEYGVSLNCDFETNIMEQFKNFNMYVVFILSKNFYQSPACLNEMGAAWVLKKNYTIILLPGFTYEDIKGTINVKQTGIKLDNGEDVKYHLREFRDELIEAFGLNNIEERKWNHNVEVFLQEITL